MDFWFVLLTVVCTKPLHLPKGSKGQKTLLAIGPSALEVCPPSGPYHLVVLKLVFTYIYIVMRITSEICKITHTKPFLPDLKKRFNKYIPCHIYSSILLTYYYINAHI